MKKISRLTALLLALLLIFQMTAVATEGSSEDIYVEPTPIPQEHLNAEIMATLSNNAMMAVAAIDTVRGMGVTVDYWGKTHLYENPKWEAKNLAEIPAGTYVIVYDTTGTSWLGTWYKVRYNGQDGYIHNTHLTLCTCNTADGAGLDAHADGCPDKMYYVSICAMTAEEIAAKWAEYTEEGKNFILLYLSWHDQVKLAALQDLLESPGEVILPDGMKVTAAGLPEGAILKVEYVSEERINTAEKFIFEGLYVTPEEDRSHSLQKALNISVQKDGEEWQPNPGESVDVEIDLGIDWINNDSCVWVTHILDTKEAIENASEKHSYHSNGLSTVYPEECAAAKDAGYGDDTVVYVALNAVNGGISYDNSGTLTIHATSLSDHILTLYNLDDSEHLPSLYASAQDVVVDKQATFANETRSGKISIDAYVTGELTSTPTDVVLVIDQSGSMWTTIKTGSEGVLTKDTMNTGKGAYEGYYACITRGTNDKGQHGAALLRYQDGVWERSELTYSSSDGVAPLEGNSSTFKGRINTILKKNGWVKINQFNNYYFFKTITGALHDALYTFKDSVKDAEKCRVAVVTFAGKNSNNYLGSGIFVNGELVANSALTDDDYENALGDSKNLGTIIEKINTNYGNTPTGLGLDYACRILSKSEAGRNRVAIVFTDGVPSDTNYGDSYLEYANKLKNLQNTTVYSLGPSNSDADVQTVLKNIGTGGEYFVADDDSLPGVFKDIADIIVKNSQKLDNNSVLTDVMAPSFKLPPGVEESDVEVYTVDYKASGFDDGTKKSFGANVEVDEKTKTVSVSGFNFSEYSVIEGRDGGKKLIIEFPYEPIDGFLGGDEVPTNDGISGIYNDDTRVEPFAEPKVNVDLRLPLPEVQDDAIYVSQAADLGDLVNVGTYKIAGSDTAWHVDGLVNEYADIIYTITAANDKYMTFTIPAGTTDLSDIEWDRVGGLSVEQFLTDDLSTYTITSKVISKNATSKTADNTLNPQTANVKVFKPEITFQDSVIDVGDPADYANDNLVSVVWKNDGKEPDDTEIIILGQAPVLTYTYVPHAEAFVQETAVKVSDVEAENVTILPYVTFKREACSYVDCPHSREEIVQHLGKDTWANFVVHMGLFDLKITKKGLSNLDMDNDETQSTLYKVTNDAGFELMVAIDRNGSIIIKDLPYGTYTITELTDWSWRYGPEGNSQTISSKNAVNGMSTAEFTNERDNPSYWLSGDSYAENAFSDAADEAGKVTASGNCFNPNGGE